MVSIMVNQCEPVDCQENEFADLDVKAFASWRPQASVPGNVLDSLV